MTEPATPGGIVSRAIILNAKLSVHARLLYAVLCCVANDQREIERSKPELIDDSGLSRATIHRAMHELTEAGIVEINSSIASDGGTRTNVYRLHEGGLTQRLPQGQTETPGVSHRDPLQGSPAQTPVSEGDPPGSQGDTGEGVSGGDGGSLLYKKGMGEISNLSTSDPSPCSSEPTTTIGPEPGRPAPEDDRPMTMLNFNRTTLPQEPVQPKAAAPRKSRRNYEYGPEFVVAWEAYGKVGGKQQAHQAWKQAIEREEIEVIMAAIPRYLASDLPKRGYTQHFATWLNDDGWESAAAQPKKSGYQGRAGSDARPQEEYEIKAKAMTIRQLQRFGLGDTEEMCRAWYYHWHVEQQRHFTEEQLLMLGNDPKDAKWLADAYANGIDPDLYQQLLESYSLTPHGSDA